MTSAPASQSMPITMATASQLYPTPSEAWIKSQFVGKQIKDVQAPATIIDAAVVRRNCKYMLDATDKLGVGFRAHVKTHKTTQLTELQVGEDRTRPVKIVASTVAEIENLQPWLRDCKQKGRAVNILYGLPISPSWLSRLASVAQELGAGSVGLFVDHPAQVKFLEDIDDNTWPGKIPVFVNIDVGYHREGVVAGSGQLADIAYALAASKKATLGGLYSHNSLSYNGKSPEEALESMAQELEGLKQGAIEFLKCTRVETSAAQNAPKVVLSLGATPTTTSIQNLLDDTPSAQKYRETLAKVNSAFEVEFHAGVYPVLDMQQLATRARPQHVTNNNSATLLSFADLAVRTLVEVASVYPDRSEKPEALVAAGTIALGREPCKSYPGWAVVTPWPAATGQYYDPEGSRTGWIVGRISQEHGILTWEGPREHMRSLEVGEKLLVWPNHACIAGVNFGWYLVVDSEKSDADKIVDVWMRWRGW